MKKMALHFVYNGQNNTYEEILLKAGETATNIFRLNLYASKFTNIYQQFKSNLDKRYIITTHDKSTSTYSTPKQP